MVESELPPTRGVSSASVAEAPLPLARAESSMMVESVVEPRRGGSITGSEELALVAGLAAGLVIVGAVALEAV